MWRIWRIGNVLQVVNLKFVFQMSFKVLELYTRAMNTMLDHVRCHYEVADQEEEVVRQGTEIFQKI